MANTFYCPIRNTLVIKTAPSAATEARQEVWSSRPVPGGVRGLVRREREKRHWTQKELSREAELSRSAVQKIETGERKPNLATAKKLARVFGLSLDEFTE